MSRLQIPCSIEARTALNPSEDPDKVIEAILNILPGLHIFDHVSYIKATSSDAAPLDTLYEMISARRAQGSLSRLIRHNVQDQTTWFYLNKQAAYAGVAAVCDYAEESPLGPIKITIRSVRIHDIIEKLADIQEHRQAAPP